MSDTRLSDTLFGLDYEAIRKGWYSDKYFINAADILSGLIREGYTFAGKSAELEAQGLPISDVAVGSLEVDMQFFTRREPFSLVAGTDCAIAIYRNCAGYWDQGSFVGTGEKLEIFSLHDGDRVAPWEPVMHVRGVYRDIAALETPVLGALTRGTRVATNVLLALEAARGKPIFFFPARYDVPQTQAADGYAYKVAVDAYNRQHDASVPVLVSTDAQGAWWGGIGGGTVSHSYILCFLKDTAEAMFHFARLAPPETKRVALVDTSNDCIRDSLAAARRLFSEHMVLTDEGRTEEAQKYVLYGVRPDTASNMLDKAIDRDTARPEDYGVSAKLVRLLRKALDEAYLTLPLPAQWREKAREYFRNIKIIVSCGFDPQHIDRFERDGVPVDVYGVGSYFLRGENTDYTGDVVAVKIDRTWVDLAKAGRCNTPSERLRAVEMRHQNDGGRNAA
jgi:nicotinate phosphoribosyltransferase